MDGDEKVGAGPEKDGRTPEWLCEKQFTMCSTEVVHGFGKDAVYLKVLAVYVTELAEKLSALHDGMDEKKCPTIEHLIGIARLNDSISELARKITLNVAGGITCMQSFVLICQHDDTTEPATK